MSRQGRFRLWCLCACLCATTVWGQEHHPTAPKEKPTTSVNNRTVNFGLKGGFTSTLFLAPHLVVDGTAIEEVQHDYEIGYFGSCFLRINFGRHFLQPEVSYHINRGGLTFYKPLPADAPADAQPEEASIRSEMHTIEMPVIYGYNFVKQGPYSMAVFGGPKVRYILSKHSHTHFLQFDQTNIHEELYPVQVCATVGVAVTISRIFFDFRYDIGLHNISKRVTYDLPTPTEGEEPPTGDAISFHRRDNVMSFSLGVFF